MTPDLRPAITSIAELRREVERIQMPTHITKEFVLGLINSFEAGWRERLDKIISWVDPIHLFDEDDKTESWQCSACEREFKTEDEALGHLTYCDVREALKRELREILGEGGGAT